MTSQSTEQITPQLGSAEDLAGRRGLGKTAAKRKRRRGPGGLGRGLARILTDSGHHAAETEPRPGLVELVGGQSAVRLAALEGAVVDEALRALMDGFDLQALAIANSPSPGQDGQRPRRRVIQPVGWSDDRATGALLARKLDQLLEQPGEGGEPRQREIPIDGYRLWLHHRVDGDRVLAVAAVRRASMPSEQAASLAVAATSLAASLGRAGADLNLRHSIHGGTTVSLKSERCDVLAEVNAEWPLPEPQRAGMRGRRTGVGRGPEPVVAVARAAAKACRPRCEVLHAGLAPGPDGDVAVVVVRHHDRSLRVGWAERPRGDLRVVAEAVFTAAL